MRLFLAILCAALLCGCSFYKPIPDGYTGPRSTIIDSFSNQQRGKADYFILTAVNGKDVENSWGRTRADNYGRGLSFTPSVVARDVLPSEQRFKVKGLVFFPTDAQVIFADDMAIEREIVFTPKPNETYRINGNLSKAGSKVWIEDANGAVIPEASER